MFGFLGLSWRPPALSSVCGVWWGRAEAGPGRLACQDQDEQGASWLLGSWAVFLPCCTLGLRGVLTWAVPLAAPLVSAHLLLQPHPRPSWCWHWHLQPLSGTPPWRLAGPPPALPPSPAFLLPEVSGFEISPFNLSL